MKKYFLIILIFNPIALLAQKKEFKPIYFDEAKAVYLYHFAYECIDQEYPNKLGQVLGDDSYLAPPRELHPAFYGCFDWHSSVHGHWTLVTILKLFPDFEFGDEILQKLKKKSHQGKYSERSGILR